MNAMKKPEVSEMPGRFEEVRLDRILSNPHQKRIIRPTSPKILSMIQSVKKYGVVEPALVRPLLGDMMEMVAGHSRAYASKEAGRTTLPCIVREMSDADAFAILVIENFDREDLNCLEEAELYAEMELMGWTLDDIEAKFGKSRRHVARRRKLTDLSARWRDVATDEAHPLNRWSPKHFELVARFDVDTQNRLLDELIVKGRYSEWKNRAKMTPGELQEYLGRYILAISGARWKASDENLCPKAGSCDACMKRSDRQQELFDVDETGKTKAGQNACCLDPSCWEQKLSAFVLAKEAELREKHGKVVPVGNDYNTKGTRWEGKAVDRYKLAKCDKREACAVPAIEVTGEESGKVFWVKDPGAKGAVGARSGSPGKGAQPEKTLADRKAAWEKKRQRLVLTAAVTHLHELANAERAIPNAVDVRTCLTLASVTGTADSFQAFYGRVRPEDFWSAFKQRLGWTPEQVAREFFWDAAEVLEGWVRIELNSLSDRKPNMTLLKHLSELLDFDYEGQYAAAVEATPYPKSWAALEAKEKAAKAPARTKAGKGADKK